jgi:hypothetical protein
MDPPVTPLLTSKGFAAVAIIAPQIGKPRKAAYCGRTGPAEILRQEFKGYKARI